jgi:hypothetical protein
VLRAKDYPITIAELHSFQKDADKVFTHEERKDLAHFLATDPSAGDVIPGTGGIRKIRWMAQLGGNHGGARVVYYFRDLNMPLFLLAVYVTGERANLTSSERSQMRSVVALLIDQYRVRWRNIIELSSKSA